jgi:hypothetical protein
VSAPTVQQERDRCRSCGTPITWAVHETTLKEAPIEAEPSPNGNIALTERGAGQLPTYAVLNAAKRFGRTGLHLNHFATCAQAPRWRRK